MTRPSSYSLIRRAVLVGAAIFLLGSASPAGAESLAAQIAALKAQSAQQQAQAAQLQGVANDYQTKVNQLRYQMAALSTQIRLNQLQYDQLSGQIETNKEKLATAKAALGANLTTMYISSNETPLEMLASSKSLGEYFDQQQYRDSIKNKIQTTMEDILKLQDQLAGQQKQVGALLASEHDQQSQLAASQAQISQLLGAAQQSAGAANSLLKSTNSLLAQKQAQQAALLQASSNTYSGSIPGASSGSGGACDNGHGNGGYPSLWCNAAQDSMQTPSGYNRECVSWAGWRWHQLGGPFVNWGNANTWDNYARAAGYTVNGTPEVGAVAQTDAGPFGHVAVVESVQGNNVIVSEMNYDNAGHFRYGMYSLSYFVYIH